jgi:hypothetical protein
MKTGIMSSISNLALAVHEIMQMATPNALNITKVAPPLELTGDTGRHVGIVLKFGRVVLDAAN